MIKGKIHMGIGFATGRTSFLNVLRAYIFHLRESHFLSKYNVLLSLYVAYDPAYQNTKKSDYDALTAEEREFFYECRFLGPEDIRQTLTAMIGERVIDESEKDQLFGSGYAVQRNIIQFAALRDRTDYLVFLDDDEYPLCVTQSQPALLWSGQPILEEHLRCLQFSDYTNGYHCGYMAPIPSIDYDGILDETMFRHFTDAMSSDVLKWESVVRDMENGGVTYADKNVLIERKVRLVEPENGAKFISGGNLGINLTQPRRVLPFYNPPGARGEDSILSTCLTDYTVKRIPVYTFHDGFGFYGSLLKGVLPLSLKKISLYDSALITDRFYRACLGWVRYKPLYTYLTQPEEYDRIMEESRERLEKSLPKVCAYFNRSEFRNLSEELQFYEKNVQSHYKEFRDAQRVWKKAVEKTVADGLVPQNPGSA